MDPGKIARVTPPVVGRKKRLMEKWDYFRRRGSLILYMRKKKEGKRRSKTRGLIVDCLELFGYYYPFLLRLDRFLFFASIDFKDSHRFGSRASGSIRPCNNDYPRGMKRGVLTWTGPVPGDRSRELQKHRIQLLISLENLSFVPDHPVSEAGSRLKHGWIVRRFQLCR